MAASDKSPDSAAADAAGGSSSPPNTSAGDEDGLGGALVRQVEELDGLIRDNPLAAVGIAAGLGVLVGLMLGRR